MSSANKGQAIAVLEAEQAARLQELENLKAQRRDTETEMADMEEGIKNSRQRLMEIKGNIEYKAMLKEIAFKEDQRDQRETRLLEFMDSWKPRTASSPSRSAQMEEQEANPGPAAPGSGGPGGEIAAGTGRTGGKAQKGAQSRAPALMKRYEFIRQRRNSSAVCPVHEGVCLGCHMNILPQQFIDLQKGLEILQCPHCQRILYWADEEAGRRKRRRNQPAPEAAGGVIAGHGYSSCRIFAALAQGLDLPGVRERFGLTPEALQELFREAADLFRDREEGFWRLRCDGASRGNPGPAGAGMVLFDPQGRLQVNTGRYLGETTNNVAEYQALLLGLAEAHRLGVKKLRILADSELMVKQLNGRYRVKAPTSSPCGGKRSTP